MRWSVLVVDNIEENVDVEMPLTWLPGLPRWWTAYADVSSATLPTNISQPKGSNTKSTTQATTSHTTGRRDESNDLLPNAQTADAGGDNGNDPAIIPSFAKPPTPSAAAATPDFAWMLRDGVGSGLSYAGSRGMEGQRGDLPRTSNATHDLRTPSSGGRYGGTTPW